MSARDDGALLQVAQAIADKTPVDWEREGEVHTGLQPRLRQLRIVEAVVTLHSSAAPDPLIGETLSHFRIVDKLGGGGMGVVYRGEDERLRRQVALKLLPPELVSNEERRLRFFREARAAAAVSHPNIATIYEVDEAGGRAFIAMELVDGRTLRELSGGRALPIDDALRIAIQMAAGLAQAHQSRVIHRDLKPDNVMVGPDQHVKILDFGLAKLLEEEVDTASSESGTLESISGEVTRVGKILGTPAYMSPEQARGEPLDARSDIFSFGSTLYEMVTGGAPFRRKTPTDTLSSIIQEEPPAPDQLNPDLPPEMVEIITKCLKKHPQDRYQDADELEGDLRRLWDGTAPGGQEVLGLRGQVTAQPVNVWRRAIATKAGRTALAACLVAVVAAASMVIWRYMRAERPFQKGDPVFVADFEDLTNRGGLGPAIRGAVEHMLDRSKLVDVIRGEQRSELLSGQGIEGLAQIGPERARRICAQGGCAGFVAGEVRQEEDGYSLRVDLYRTGNQEAAESITSGPHPEDELLGVVHGAVVKIRKTLGESPQAISVSGPPTTRSLRAYQMLSSLADAGGLHDDGSLTVIKKALEIDPEFVEARDRLAIILWNLGDMTGFRQAVEEVYRQSAVLSEYERMMAEINFLEVNYEFDTEIQRLKAATLLYPEEALPWTFLCLLYAVGYEDVHLAERSCREAYRLAPRENTLNNLTSRLGIQGKFEEIEEIVQDFRARHGLNAVVYGRMLARYGLKDDEKENNPTLSSVSNELGRLDAGMVRGTLNGLLAAGRFGEARTVASLAWSAAAESGSSTYAYSVALRLAWLEARHSSRPVPVREESLTHVRGSLPELVDFATFAVDMRWGDELEQLIQEHEIAEEGSKSRFVREQLQFARGCLALIRGEAQEALRALEPLARKSTLAYRHLVLGRTYEALGMWTEAATGYEGLLQDPYLMRNGFVLPVPQLMVLEQHRLAQVYERLGNSDRARLWYERFLEDWKDADQDIPEVIEARERVVALHRVEAAAL